MHQEFHAKIEEIIFEFLVSLRDPEFVKNRETILNEMREQIENIVFNYNMKKMHKLVFFLLIKA